MTTEESWACPDCGADITESVKKGSVTYFPGKDKLKVIAKCPTCGKITELRKFPFPGAKLVPIREKSQ